jgi:hypothetical protein
MTMDSAGETSEHGVVEEREGRRLACGAAGMEEVARVIIERPREAPQNSGTLLEQLLFAGDGKE